MTKRNISYRILRLMLAMFLGAFISAFSLGASTAHAAETEEHVSADAEQMPLDENSQENSGGAVIILMGGMLLIIIAVVITVVATVVSTAPIADEI